MKKVNVSQLCMNSLKFLTESLVQLFFLKKVSTQLFTIFSRKCSFFLHRLFPASFLVLFHNSLHHYEHTEKRNKRNSSFASFHRTLEFFSPFISRCRYHDAYSQLRCSIIRFHFSYSYYSTRDFIESANF